MSDPISDEERLAALLDGRLDARERDALLARLADDDDALALLADAAAVARELEEDAGEEDAAGDGAAVAPVTPLAAGRRRPWMGRVLAVAAVVAGLAVVPVLWMQGRDGRADAASPAALLADGGSLPAGWDARPWTTTRGAGDPLTDGARAVRVGALLTDLELAVRGRDPAAARLAEEVALLLEPVPAAGPVAARYFDVAGRAGAEPGELLPLLTAGRGEAAGVVGAERMALGEWAEAGRIAAVRRDAAFFRAPATAAAFGRAAAVPGLPVELRAALERVRLATGEGGEPDWAVLERDLATVLRVGGS